MLNIFKKSEKPVTTAKDRGSVTAPTTDAQITAPASQTATPQQQAVVTEAPAAETPKERVIVGAKAVENGATKTEAPAETSTENQRDVSADVEEDPNPYGAIGTEAYAPYHDEALKILTQDYDAPDYDGSKLVEAIAKNKAEEESAAKRARQILAITAIGDAIRHAGNIAFTSDSAPAQIYNYNPALDVDTRYRTDKATREKYAQLEQTRLMNEAKMKSDAYYKAWNAKQKQASGILSAGQKKAAIMQKDASDDYTRKKNAKEFKYKKEENDRKFTETQRMHDNTIRHQKVLEGQGATRIALSKERNAIERKKAANGGSGGGRYITTAKGGTWNRKTDWTSDEKKYVVERMRKMRSKGKSWLTEEKYNAIQRQLNKDTDILDTTPTTRKKGETIKDEFATAIEYALEHYPKEMGNIMKEVGWTQTSSSPTYQYTDDSLDL